jgi:hypothetical protein
MGQGDVPTSRGGPFRRRREKRQLEHLAEASGTVVTPMTSSAHVRVIEDQADASRKDVDDHEAELPVSDSLPVRTGGFHIRAVPIDQPLGE